MAVERAYRSFKGHIETLRLTESMFAVHAYSQYLQYRIPINPKVQVDPIFYKPEELASHPHQWELEILVIELILHGSLYGTRSLAKWSDLAGAINKLRALEEEISSVALESGDVLFEVNRIAHRQFIWQRRSDSNLLLRYFRIYSDVELDKVVVSGIGLSATHIYRLALLFHAFYTEKPFVDYPFSAEDLDLTQDQVTLMVDRFSRSIFQLQDEITKTNIRDENYAYRFNPMKAYPIIKAELDVGAVLICPIPTLLFWRFTEGLYYELVSVPGFDRAFGQSFQKYIGDVFREVNVEGRLNLYEEQQYIVGKSRKDSIDWIVSDLTGNVFVECKTKRLTLASKLSLSIEGLEADINKMVEFILQGYKSIQDAIDGLYNHWKPNGLPSFLVIQTLEDWYISNSNFGKEIDRKVREGIEEAKCDPALLDSVPYFVCSAWEMETAFQVINVVGIYSFMSKWKERKTETWGLRTFLTTHFKSELSSTKKLFPNEWKNIHPGLSNDS